MARNNDQGKGGNKGRRRSYGIGSVWQLPSGKWTGAYSLGKVAGKYKREYVYGDTQREAEEKLQSLAVKYRAGDLIASADKHTVSSFLDLWLEQAVKPHTSPSTYRSRKDTINLHVKPFMGSTRLDKVTAQQVQTLLNQLAVGFVRVPSMTRATLHAAFAQAVAWSLLPKNPISGTKNPRTVNRQIEPLTIEQAKRLLDSVTGHRLEALFRITLGLGLRRQEVLTLLWSDVDLKKGTLRIRLVNAKTPRSAATLPLSAKMTQILQDQWVLVQQERRVPDWEEHGLVFPSNRGTQLGTTSLFRTYKSALKRAKLPLTTRFHDLRHSCATILLAMGADLRYIMDVMRHTNIKMTTKYAHVLEEGRRAAVTLLDDVVGKPSEADQKKEGEGT